MSALHCARNFSFLKACLFFTVSSAQAPHRKSRLIMRNCILMRQQCLLLLFRDSSVCANSTNYETQDLDCFRNLIKDSETEKKVKVILMEFMLDKQVESRLPDQLTENDMANLLKIESYSGRRSYILRYLHVTSIKKIANLRKKEERKVFVQTERELRLQGTQEDHIRYDLGHNCLHFRVNHPAVRPFYAHRLCQAVMFGQPLVFDCDFDNYMTHEKNSITATQLIYAHSVNYTHTNPFDLYFCNLRKTSEDGLLDKLERTHFNIDCPTSMITVTEKSYFDLFPDKNLVYLSPDAPDTMDTFDNDAIYIIGALEDVGRKVRRTLAKAKKENIPCQKLPLDNYLIFKPGGRKTLPLNIVTSILLEMSSSGNWVKALKIK